MMLLGGIGSELELYKFLIKIKHIKTNSS